MMEIENVLKRFGASLEWPMERISIREDEIEKIRTAEEIEGQVNSEKLKAMKTKSIDDVLVEVSVLIDMHLFNAFTETRSSLFLKWAIVNQNSIEMHFLKKTWRTLNCFQKR